MLFAIYCKDKINHADVRAANRAAHLEYVQKINDKIIRGGPLLSDDGKGMIGSLLVVDFEDKAAAEEWAANDPYAKAELFESVEITPWKVVLPL